MKSLLVASVVAFLVQITLGSLNINDNAPLQVADALTLTTLRHPATSSGTTTDACNSTLHAGFDSLKEAVDSFDSVVKGCLASSGSGSASSGSPFSKLSPTCVAGIDSILYDLSNSSIAFTKAVQRCAPSGGGNSSSHSLTPREEKCQDALSNITKYEFMGAVAFPQIVHSCNHNPSGYDCRSGVPVLILLAVKLLEFQPEMIANCIF